MQLSFALGKKSHSHHCHGLLEFSIVLCKAPNEICIIHQRSQEETCKMFSWPRGAVVRLVHRVSMCYNDHCMSAVVATRDHIM